MPEPEWAVRDFGDPGQPAFAHGVVHAAPGFVAVGVQYSAPLPNLGPVPPHEGRIWLSSDGSAWEDVTPSGTFTNVTLDGVFVRADGSLVATGGKFQATEFSGAEVELVYHGAWESSDGLIWGPSMTGPGGTVAGARGYLALVDRANTPIRELWHSADGFNWALVRELNNASVAIGAGDEGFVAVGTQGPPEGPSLEPFGIASADGLVWFEATNPPANPSLIQPLVAPLGGDWVAIINDLVPENPTIWFSSDGLEWTPHGEAPLQEVEAGPGWCHEYPTHLSSAGGWLFLGTVLSHPCSEGGFVVHGTQWISGDGASWEPLPFETGTVGVSGSGSQVYAAAEGDGHLVLVGQMNGKAALWSLSLR